MGGSIYLDASYTQGARFCFNVRVNCLGEKPKLAAPRHQPPAPSEKGSFVALIVEDDATNSMVLSLILTKMGFEISSCENGALAIELCEKQTFDIIFMDVKMPVMDGLEATRELRRRGLETPIIAVTAHAYDRDRQACFDAGMNDWLTKPLRTPKLKSSIERLGLLVAISATNSA